VYNPGAGKEMLVTLKLRAFLLVIALTLAVSCSDDDPTYKPKPDTTAPVLLSGPTISNITQHSATVSWTTDDPSTSVVTFASDTTLWGFLVPVKDMNLVREHRLVIASNVYGEDEIPPGTLVYYDVASRNAAGLTTRTPLTSFTTLP
jgi:hypothetical protein